MQEPVLVLNANFEPINICTTRRAVGLILGGKAAMVTNGRGYIHTVKELIPRPSVIRLEMQIHRPRPRCQADASAKSFAGIIIPASIVGVATGA